MIRLFVVLVLGVLALSVGAWYVNDEFTQPEPKPTPSASPTPSQADRLMAFCGKPANRDNALCKVDPNDPEAVRDAVERIVEQSPPLIIERERDNDDDGSDQPDVNVIVPRATTAAPRPTPTPSRTTAPPLLPIEIPAVPEVPVPVPDLPLLN